MSKRGNELCNGKRIAKRKYTKGKGKEKRKTHEDKNVVSFQDSSVDSTLTPLDELTTRMSLPSSANSLFKTTFPAASVSRSRSPVVSGLSPSSTDGTAKSGFRSFLRKASAMIAASAPDKGPPLSLVVDAASVVRFLVGIKGETPVTDEIPIWGGSGGLSYL